MGDKKLLVILTLVAIYVFTVRSMYNNFDYQISQLVFIEKSVFKEQFIKKKLHKIKLLYSKYSTQIRKNNDLFFSPKVSDSEAMSKMQSFIKALATKSGVQLLSINWGAKVDKNDYIILPISFSLKGKPKQLDMFLKEIYKFNKIIKFESVNITTSAYSDVIVLNSIVEGFKLKRYYNEKI